MKASGALPPESGPTNCISPTRSPARPGFLGTLRENGGPVAFALRLRIENRRIREIESMVVRDAAAAKAIEAMGRPDPLFSEALPASERRSRKDLIAIANKYYDGIEQSKGSHCPVRSNCARASKTESEPPTIPDLKIDPNSSWTPLSLGCKDQLDTRFFSFVHKVDPRRFLIVDEERGLVFGFFEFLVPGTVKSVDIPGHGAYSIPLPYQAPLTIQVAELYKIVNGKILRVEALQTNVPYGTPNPFAAKTESSARASVGNALGPPATAAVWKAW